jgi:N-acetylglucosamine kinase-like BadF-type ATPase
MRYILGIDGGASKTHALVVYQTGCALGFGQAGTGNHQVRGLESAIHEVESAIRTALSQINPPPVTVDCGYYCLAGADLPEDYTMLQAAVERLGLSRAVVIDNDTMAALRAGLSRSWGVVVICGTGFNGAGKGPDGREVRMPGLGPISGDISGGSAMAYDALRAVMRAWDGRGKPRSCVSQCWRCLARLMKRR